MNKRNKINKRNKMDTLNRDVKSIIYSYLEENDRNYLDKRYDKILPKPWGEISVIFYKEGYIDYALFYLQVLEGNTRENVEILMFENGKMQSDQPFSIIEGPNKIWVNEMITKHK